MTISAKEKMAMVRLAVTLEKLHTTATDPSIPQEEGVEASAELAMTILRHFEMVTKALRHSGKATAL